VVLISHILQKTCGISLAFAWRVRRTQRLLLSIASVFIAFPAGYSVNTYTEVLQNSDNSHNAPKLPKSVNLVAKKLGFAPIFQQLGVEGSILIYDASNNKFYEHNSLRNSKAFTPGSTFKIFNTLVALETEVIRDEVTVLTWDGINRNWAGIEIPAWNRDTNMRQAFKDSTVWFYQVLARKIGHEPMNKFIDRANYGNRQIGTQDKIDRFWLEGPLQTTARQQIEFLQKVYSNNLPFSQRHINLLKDIMIVEQTPNYILRGKTGWVTSQNPHLGWFVGYLEQNHKVYFFATNIDMPSPKLAKYRVEITRRCLQQMGLLEVAKN
jgi:beta-lactamase class D